jgi:hypothetical protein
LLDGDQKPVLPRRCIPFPLPLYLKCIGQAYTRA